MENKYFVPDISEMHVGCEFEMNDTWGGWKKLVLTEELLKQPMVGLGSGNERSPWYWNFRIPYLTKEQIENQDWKFLPTTTETYLVFMRENTSPRLELAYDLNDYSLEIRRHFFEEKLKINLFKGECKDINTFRLICKLLKI